MKNFAALSIAFFTAATAPALADVMVEDTDGNGSFSLEELQVAYPALTEEIFAEIDTNEDGTISAEELTAAADADLLPKES
ncbi:EF-hand domain-containing protein [Cognatishimia sp. SS12]|uniref:EF-hand domain-containing protein n=1 Tax=Cognatishimia sp. SS12 TaxID=2979465 RepID=UPI002330A633|nr:EF-hand domain-containing protein [Cognatishimia sp. SS12]MDC0738540.1 EF-hand domain-containing protein [Cognatishimia sp. SS12]